MSIVDELNITVEKYRRYARRNYYAVYGLYVVAVSASILGTFMALIGSLPGPVLAIISAIPGTALFIMQTFRLSERANWHFEKKNRLNALRRVATVTEDATSNAEIAKKWNEIDEKMEKAWPAFGTIQKTSRATSD